MAALFIIDLRFSRVEGLTLAALFLGQFAFTSTEVRYVFIALYLVVALALLLKYPERRAELIALITSGPLSLRAPPARR
jgi:hypothetical protein